MARASKGPLPDFEKRAVSRSEVKITRAGDGLSDALKVAPAALHHGERVFFVLEGEVTQVNHKPIGKDEVILARVHTVEAQTIAMVDESEVRALLDNSQALLREAQEAASGQYPIPGAGLAPTPEIPEGSAF